MHIRGSYSGERGAILYHHERFKTSLGAGGGRQTTSSLRHYVFLLLCDVRFVTTCKRTRFNDFVFVSRFPVVYVLSTIIHRGIHTTAQHLPFRRTARCSWHATGTGRRCLQVNAQQQTTCTVRLYTGNLVHIAIRTQNQRNLTAPRYHNDNS